MNSTKTIVCFVSLLLSIALADARTYRVHYSVRGSGNDIDVVADTAAEARLTVQCIVPGATVTGVREIKPARK